MVLKKGTIAIVAVALLLLTLLYVIRYETSSQQAEVPVRKVPIQDVVLSETIASQKYVFVHFFSSWCEACHAQHKKLMALSKVSPFPIVGVAFQNRPEEMTAFLKEEGSPFQQIVYDVTGKIALSFGLRGVPETFLIRVSDGAMLYHHLGISTQHEMETKLLPLLQTLNEESASR